METRFCSHCQVGKSLADFHPSKKSWCKSCVNKDNRERAQRRAAAEVPYSKRSRNYLCRMEPWLDQLVAYAIERERVRHEIEKRREQRQRVAANLMARALEKELFRVAGLQKCAACAVVFDRIGRESRCKACVSRDNREYRLANLERMRARDRMNTRDRVNTPERKALAAKNYLKNKEKYNAASAKWHRENRAHVRTLQSLSKRGIRRKEVPNDVFETLVTIRDITLSIKDRRKSNGYR